jgi:hypothetical protein
MRQQPERRHQLAIRVLGSAAQQFQRSPRLTAPQQALGPQQRIALVAPVRRR